MLRTRPTCLVGAALLAVFVTTGSHQAAAGTADYQATLTASNFVDQIATRLDATGSFTSIVGFPSLAGVPPSDVTFTIADLELTGTNFGSSPWRLYYGGPGTITIDQSGSPIGTGTLSLVEIVDPMTGTATANGTIVFNGPPNSPFYQDIFSQSGGTGITFFTVDSFDAYGSNPYAITGTFSIPEPGGLTLLGLGTAGLLCFVWNGRRKP